jgi:hypothetical protein
MHLGTRSVAMQIVTNMEMSAQDVMADTIKRHRDSLKETRGDWQATVHGLLDILDTEIATTDVLTTAESLLDELAAKRQG